MDTKPNWPSTGAQWGWYGHIKGAENVSFVKLVDPYTGRFMTKIPFTSYIEEKFDVSQPIIAY